MSKDENSRDQAASEFLRMVSASLEALTSTGLLSFETSRYDETFFGNAFVIFRGKHIRVRFVRDRSTDVVELACLNKPDSWQPIERVLSAVGVPVPPEGSLGLDAATALLSRHVNTIDTRMCTDEVAAKLSELEAAATRQVLESLERFKPR
jgi:hypothetical protein